MRLRVEVVHLDEVDASSGCMLPDAGARRRFRIQRQGLVLPSSMFKSIHPYVRKRTMTHKTNRRDFLKKTGALSAIVAAPYIATGRKAHAAPVEINMLAWYGHAESKPRTTSSSSPSTTRVVTTCWR